jgi:hypothetical protein
MTEKVAKGSAHELVERRSFLFAHLSYSSGNYLRGRMLLVRKQIGATMDVSWI